MVASFCKMQNATPANLMLFSVKNRSVFGICRCCYRWMQAMLDLLEASSYFNVTYNLACARMFLTGVEDLQRLFLWKLILFARQRFQVPFDLRSLPNCYLWVVHNFVIQRDQSLQALAVNTLRCFVSLFSRMVIVVSITDHLYTTLFAFRSVQPAHVVPSRVFLILLPPRF